MEKENKSVKFIFLTLIICFSCYTQVDTFYPIDKTKIEAGRNINLIDNDKFKCYSSFSLSSETDNTQSIEFRLEMHKNEMIKIKDMCFLIKANESAPYQMFNHIVLTGTHNPEDSGEKSMEELTKVINNQAWTTAIFYFSGNGQKFDSLYLKYKIELYQNETYDSISSEEIFVRGTYNQPISR